MLNNKLKKKKKTNFADYLLLLQNQFPPKSSRQWLNYTYKEIQASKK